MTGKRPTASDVPANVARLFVAQGVSSTAEIAAWFGVGIAPKSAAGLRAAGIEPDTALAWFRAGWPPAEAIERVAQGGTVVARSDVDPLKFAAAFRHNTVFSIRDAAWARVNAAITGLCVPVTRRSMMFGDADTTAEFLDGGWRSHEGYGFGSWSGDSIAGTRAVRFICARCGVTPPRRMKGEDLVPTTEELDAEFLLQLPEAWR